MTAFQEAMVETARGIGEGVMGAAVLRGLSVAPASGMAVSVAAGIAISASGYLDVLGSSETVSIPSADPSLITRSLVVITPMPTDSNLINSPTTPFTQVPLNQLQEAAVMVIPGTPSSSPEYPSKGPNDVILCGLIIPPGAASITSSMLDFEARESIGVNSLIAQNQVRFDNRMRPYRSSSTVMGIKPSQNVGSAPLCFSYPGRLTPSLFPLTAGSFTPEDTFVDFSTGVVSGGDSTTPSFGPTTPAGNKSVVCVVTLTQKDTLNFNFGDVNGTYDQCLASIQNQVFSGPGSLPAPDGNFGIAYVIITSNAGAVSDVQVFDGRPFLGSGAAAAKYRGETPRGAVNGTNTVFTLSSTPSDPESVNFYVDQNLLTDQQYEINGDEVTITDPGAVPAPGQSVWAKYLVYGAVSNNPSSGVQTARFKQEIPTGAVDGSNADFQLSSVPVDPDSLDVWIDENHLELTDFTLVGNSFTITNPDFIPQPGQSIYSKYLYLGVLLGGGGGASGSAGYTPHGSKASPVVVNPASGIMTTSDPLQVYFVRSPSGAQVVTKSPQISAGSSVGQVVKIKAVDGTNFPVFNDGDGLDLNGPWPATGDPASIEGSTIELSWDGVNWSEDSRR
jgi:hypothetical protein